MKFDLYVSKEKDGECFDTKMSVFDEKTLAEAASYRHTAVQFKDGIRNNDSFLSSNVMMFDCNNLDSRNVEDWVYSIDITRMLPYVKYALVYPKRYPIDRLTGQERPCFHIYFPVSEGMAKNDYIALKKLLHRIYPCFSSASAKSTIAFPGIRGTDYSWNTRGTTIDDSSFMEMARLDEKTLVAEYGHLLSDGKGGR